MTKYRIWKLGKIGDSPQNSILPKRDTIEKLQSILNEDEQNDKRLGFVKKVVNIVWGPDLTVEEYDDEEPCRASPT